MTGKELLIRFLFKVNPYWDEIPWNRERDRILKSYGLSVKKRKSQAKFRTRPVHVVVVPQHGPGDSRYVPGERNLYFEAATSLTEYMGIESVSVLSVGETEPVKSWEKRLRELIDETNATHILTHIEQDPGNQVDNWNWDKVFNELLQDGWDGVLLGVNFDSAFKWIRAKSRRLAKISPQFVAVDICMSLDGELVSNRPEVGPVNMPVSQVSLRLSNSEIANVEKRYDVSFIGALYPYRVDLIENLRIRGIDVVVNPHRNDETHDFTSSTNNQPSWLRYMQGLASSHMTINFSRSSAGPYEQLKTRVIEAGLAGTYLLTDDKDRTRLFFPPDEFSAFESVDDLPDLIESLLEDKADLDARARRAQVRARELAVTNFWDGIDQGLIARGLPAIF
ncbi:glycosyltransferase [bacterium]|nr:glycosyltransferase [Actinomycetota bacterium]MDA9870026.1 glycosyltransferase [bacterium]